MTDPATDPAHDPGLEDVPNFVFDLDFDLPRPPAPPRAEWVARRLYRYPAVWIAVRIPRVRRSPHTGPARRPLQPHDLSARIARLSRRRR